MSANCLTLQFSWLFSPPFWNRNVFCNCLTQKFNINNTIHQYFSYLFSLSCKISKGSIPTGLGIVVTLVGFPGGGWGGCWIGGGGGVAPNRTTFGAKAALDGARGGLSKNKIIYYLWAY